MNRLPRRQGCTDGSALDCDCGDTSRRADRAVEPGTCNGERQYRYRSSWTTAARTDPGNGHHVRARYAGQLLLLRGPVLGVRQWRVVRQRRIQWPVGDRRTGIRSSAAPGCAPTIFSRTTTSVAARATRCPTALATRMGAQLGGASRTTTPRATRASAAKARRAPPGERTRGTQIVFESVGPASKTDWVLRARFPWSSCGQSEHASDGSLITEH
jgi:hypothetical protein